MALQLPPEIWQKILPDLEFADLRSLSAVHGYLNQLTAPYVYAKYAWVPDVVPCYKLLRDSGEGLWSLKRPSSTHKFHKALRLSSSRSGIHFFLRTITNRSDLAVHVKSIKILCPLQRWSNLLMPLWEVGHNECGFLDAELGFLT